MQLSVKCENGGELKTFDSNTNTDRPITLAELNEDWRDAPEEPKEYWCISQWGDIVQRRKLISIHDEDMEAEHKEIGYYFETKEEAEKAVRKLQAWKRLKDKWFEFRWIDMQTGQIRYSFFLKEGQKITRGDEDDLLLLFGGEE